MFKIIFNTLLGIVLIFIWSRFVDLNQIIVNLSKVNLIYLGPILLFMLLSPVIRAVRLQIFLSEIKKISLLDLIYLNGVAMILNFFIPIRAGEIAKGVYLNTKYDLSLGKSVIWIFIDRFVDFLAVLLLAAVLLLTVPTSLPDTFKTTIIIILVVALNVTYLAVFQVKLARRMANLIKSILIEKHLKLYFEKLSNFILESFAVLDRHPKDLSLMTGITVLAYMADASIWFFAFLALGSPQDYFKMYLGQLLSALTYLVPAAPGYVGSAEASGLLILSGVFGINPNLSSAMIVLFHVLSAIFVLIFGLISIYSLKINLGVVFNKVLKRS